MLLRWLTESACVWGCCTLGGARRHFGSFGSHASRSGAASLHKGMPHPSKHRSRLTKSALQQSRQRAQVQMQTSHIRQSINQAHGEHQRQRAKTRAQLADTAYGLIYNKHAARDAHAVHYQSTGDGVMTRGSAVWRGDDDTGTASRDRVAAMATARHLLQVEEGLRRHMKQGRGMRRNMFRALKFNN